MTATGYAKRKERAQRQQSEQSRAGREIGPLPPVADPARRREGMRSFRAFCEVYEPDIYSLPWSADHLAVVDAIELAVRGGYLCAFAMPRGSGKTSLCESGVTFAALKGLSLYSVIIGANESKALANLEAIHNKLTTNRALMGDFPEVCWPLERLEGVHQRRLLFNGRPVLLEVTKQRLVLPAIPGSLAASAVIETVGLTGAVRGLKYSRPDGVSVRPSLVMVDDPQTDESARSPGQCETRERILAGAVLGLAGPGRKISGVMPCTVIRRGDMADAILDREKHPEWAGRRTKMVYSFPTSDLWDEYRRLRDAALRAGEASAVAATQFYREHRSEMDAGAAVAWADRFNSDEISAIQHVQNLRFRDERAFFAEYQNDPLPEQEARSDDLSADQIAGRVNNLPAGAVGLGCNRLTGFVDVQASLLYWCVCAWEDDFTGSVVAYGTWPDQGTDYFTLQQARRTLDRAITGAGLEGRIYGGLEVLADELCGREWVRDDGAVLKLERLGVDAGWSTAVVHRFCRQSRHAGVLLPSHGKYVGASGLPMSEWQSKPGDRPGHNWRVRLMNEAGRVRAVVFDTNYWKSFVLARLSCSMGDRGALSLFGRGASAHRLFADHCCAEFRIRTEGRGRTVDEWKIRPERMDNHYWDCLVGCAVGASVLGVSLGDVRVGAPAVRKPRVDFAGQARKMRGGP